MNADNDTGNAEKLPLHNLPLGITDITLEQLLTLLGGDEWRPALRAAVGKGLKWISHVCNGKNNLENLVWEKTIIKTEIARKWFAKQPVFSGRFKGAPPILTRNRILERLGSICATSLEQADLSKDRAAHFSEDLFKTADVVAWYSSLQPKAPATPESIPPVETSLSDLPKRGGIALVEAENAALAALRKALKREPDFVEFWDYLTTRDETGTVADFTDCRLDWVGHSGKSCSTAKSTFRNRLTAAKKRNPFTPS